MCLAVPMQVLSKEGLLAKVMSNGIEMAVALDLTPDAIPGDYVIVHAGFAISKLSKEEAEETLLIFERLERAWASTS
ncbi:MAG: HypC/HybG/HupF family hydrogenase formation chaperone [Myxococcota bacterium]|nr:HypC/HybG/HupF family hydrogenase formation chaperone [Myxococcota bacterium]